MKGPFVVYYGLLGLLNVHEGRGYKLEVLNTALGIQDLQVASRVVISILELVKVNLRLLLLGLDEATVVRADLLQHIQRSFGVAHLQSKVRLGQHDLDFFRSVCELTNSARQDFFGLVELLEFTIHIDQV